MEIELICPTSGASSVTPEASDRSSPSRLLRLLPAGATLAGRDLHPLKNRAFPRHTVTLR
jgi:hypothetical protein